MTRNPENSSSNTEGFTMPTGEKITDAISPLEQLDRLRRLTEGYPSYLRVPIDYDYIEGMLQEVDEKDLGDERLLTLFVEHRTKESTESFNWGLLKNGLPSFPGSRENDFLTQEAAWLQTAWNEPFRYKPGLHLIELKFFDATGKSVTELKAEHERLAGIETLPAISLQKDQFSRFNLGDIIVAGIRKSIGESTEIVPVMKIDDHRHHKADAIYSDTKIEKGYVPVVTATCLLQDFQW